MPLLSLAFHIGVHILTPTTSVGAGSAKIPLELHRGAKPASQLSNQSLATNHGSAHNTQPSTCTTDGRLIAALGASYVDTTRGAIIYV